MHVLQASTLDFTHDYALVYRYIDVVGISKISRACGQRWITKLGYYNNTVAMIYNAILYCTQIPKKRTKTYTWAFFVVHKQNNWSLHMPTSKRKYSWQIQKIVFNQLGYCQQKGPTKIVSTNLIAYAQPIPMHNQNRIGNNSHSNKTMKLVMLQNLQVFKSHN